jgi:hypothetical protein
MKEWVTRYREYDRVTQKTSLAADPYSYMDRGREQREFLQLRYDSVPLKSEPKNQYIDGRLRMSIPVGPIQRVKKESIITRIKNKIKW